MNISLLLRNAAKHYQSKPILRYRGRDVRYEEMSEQIARLTGSLKTRGIGPDSRVMIFARNKPEWLISLFASLNTGALVVPINPALTSNEVGYMLEHGGPQVVIADNDLVATLSSGKQDFDILSIADDGSGSWHDAMARGTVDCGVAEVNAGQAALMFYTSGTTGRPKGALLSHGAEVFTAEMVASHFRLKPDDVSLISNSLSFIYPLVIDCLASIHAGATVILQDRFHPELCLRGIEEEKATILMGVPTMFTMMLDWAQDKYVDASSLRYCISAGQNLSWNIATRFRERFGCAVYDLWGQTEGTPITGYDPSLDPEGHPESCGRALPNCRVRIIDDNGRDLPPDTVGEILLSGPNMFLGYDNNPAATAETLRSGWVYTGDLGKLDREGFLYIVGRKRDLVIRGGANIYPTEVEEAIYAHPAVADCAVIGVPDRTYGELVKAFVVIASGQRLSEQGLIAHCRERLAEYKVPSLVSFLESLPKGPTGKVLKRELRKLDSQNGKCNAS